MSDSEVSAASDSFMPFEEVNCPSIKIETELDIEQENSYDFEQTCNSNFKNELVRLNRGNECAIERLLQKPFSSLSYQEKIYYIKNDRPTEPLNDLFKPSKGRRNFTRHFNIKSYETVPWLSGCSRLGRLFCWPCLLFCQGKNVWNSTGYEDLNHFHTAIKRHRMSSHHITSFKQLKQFNKSKSNFCFSNQFQISVPVHNIEVKKNWAILSHMVKAVCFLSKEGLFRSNGKSVNKRLFVEFLKELSEYDHDLKNLINSTNFSHFINNLEVLIASVHELVTNKIKEKISESPCIALILDNASDLNDHLISMSVRYVAKDGNMRETFMGFKQMNKELKAKALTLHIYDFLHKFSCDKKFIAYSYDGGVLPSSEYNNFETEMKHTFPTARFENYYAHPLDVVISQSLSFIKRCRVFFSNLSSMESFFTKSKPALEAQLKEKLGFHSSAWECSELLEIVHTNQENIVSFLNTIICSAEKWDFETVCSARGLHSMLDDFEFNLLLKVFSIIFAEIAKLNGFLKKNSNDISGFDIQMENFKSAINQVKEDFDSIWIKCKRLKNESEEYSPNGKIRIDTIPAEDSKSSYRQLLNEIAFVVLTNIEYRLGRFPKLQFMDLLDFNKFEKFKTKFPVSQFNALKSNYEKYFDFEALKGELTVFSLDKEMHKDNVLQLIGYLVSADLMEIFPEVLKLASLILTIPTYCCSKDGERTASVSQRVKAYFRITKGQERTPALATLTIEKNLLSELRNFPTFMEDVVDIFSQKNPPNVSLVY